MTQTKKLSDLQVGDKVIFWDSSRRNYQVKEIVRTTPTQIITHTSNTEHFYKFYKKDGKEINSFDYTKCWIEVYTDDRFAKLEIDRIYTGKRRRLNNMNLYPKTTEDIHEVYDFLFSKGLIEPIK